MVGSVHFLRRPSVDAEDYSIWGTGESAGAGVWRRYFETLAEAARSGLYDIVSHADLVEVGATRRRSRTATCGATTSRPWRPSRTSAWRSSRRPPAGASRSAAVPGRPVAGDRDRCRLPIALSSDAHQPDQLGFEYERAVELLGQVGVRGLPSSSGGGGAGAVGAAGIGIDSHRSRIAAGSSSAASRSRSSAASPATRMPTCSSTRSPTPCSAPPGSATSAAAPDTEEAWKDADSMELLRDVVARVRAAGHGSCTSMPP